MTSSKIKELFNKLTEHKKVVWDLSKGRRPECPDCHSFFDSWEEIYVPFEHDEGGYYECYHCCTAFIRPELVCKDLLIGDGTEVKHHESEQPIRTVFHLDPIQEERDRIWEEACKTEKEIYDLFSDNTQTQTKYITLIDLKKIIFGEEKE